MSDEAVAGFYFTLMNDFPTCHFVFSSIVSTRFHTTLTYNDAVVDGVETKTEQLHRKQRMVLYVFLGLLRTRNRLLLKHYSMV